MTPSAFQNKSSYSLSWLCGLANPGPQAPERGRYLREASFHSQHHGARRVRARATRYHSCAPFAIAVAPTAPEGDHGINILGNPQSVA